MIDYLGLLYRVERMQLSDIEQVVEIDRASFSNPWTARAYDYDLRYNAQAHYIVARPQMAAAGAVTRPGLIARIKEILTGVTPPRSAPEPIVGFGGYWMQMDEAHISTIAVRSDVRRRYIGELLLAAMMDQAAEERARVVTLEVRVSNTVAQMLYNKYGFQTAGFRKAYYSNNGEDAYIMTTPEVGSAEFQRRFQELKRQLRGNLAAQARGE
jgi:ribosomal-protein-alanine N-acetyltransferase